MSKFIVALALSAMILSISSCIKHDHYKLSDSKRDGLSHMGQGVWIKVPEGFKEAKSYDGFQNAKYGASISLEVSTDDFAKVKDNYSKEALAAVGCDQRELSTILYGESSEGFYSVDFNDGSRTVQYRMGVHHEGKTYLIKAFYYDPNEFHFEKPIKAALLSVYIGEAIDRKKGFEMATIVDGKIIYTRDGQYPSQSYDEATIMINSFEHKGNLMSNTYRQEYINNIVNPICQVGQPITWIKNIDNAKMLTTEFDCDQTYGYALLLYDADDPYASVATATTTMARSRGEIKTFISNQLLKVDFNAN